ncbi:MAG: L,D-transpeptidase family protein [Acidimicrobiia bacterium]
MLRRTVIAIVIGGLLAPILPTTGANALEIYTGEDQLYNQSSASTTKLQTALKEKGFYRGAIDGSYGIATQHAVMAFRKEIGTTRSYSWSDSLWDELEIYQAPYTKFDEPDRVEVNLTKQTAHLFRNGDLVATFPISSGNGESYYANGSWRIATTPTGDFEVYRHSSGWYESTLGLGLMLSPWFFTGGIAFHGSSSVPPTPASHGCIRLTTWDSNFIDKHLFIGIPVHVYRSSEGPVYGSDGPFADVPADHVFASAVQWMLDQGFTNGCSAYFYCVNDSATRGEIAAFMKRTLEPHLGAATSSSFTDTQGHMFEAAIGWLAGHGITQGCDPPANANFCPDRRVTRGEVSAMFKRAVETLIAVDPAAIDPTRFSDTQDSLYVNSAAWLAASGITVGCNPPANTKFCPDQYVTRGQLAVFFKRILDRL